MKERHLFTLLSVEAAACVLFCILQRSLSGLFSTLIAFPFEQIGAGLRILSLSGAVGNVIAIILYMLLGLIPAGIWFARLAWGRGKILQDLFSHPRQVLESLLHLLIWETVSV